MRKKTLHSFLGLAAVLAACAVLCLHDTRTKEETVEFAVFNTFCSLHYFSEKPEDSAALSRDIIARLQKLHNRINVYDSASELHCLNRDAAVKPVVCSPELWDILQVAREAWKVTGGEFDISVGPLMHLWGFHGKRRTIPSEQEIGEALVKVGLQKVVFNEQDRSVFFPVPGMKLDLGGIAKGYALDLAVKMLEESGLKFTGVLFNFGGNIFARGRNAAGRQFNIGIRTPEDAGKLYRNCQVDGRYIATSANYERALRIGEKKIGHIVSPVSGRPVKNYASVSIVASAGWQSDVFSTAVFAGGEKTIRKIQEYDPQVEVFLQ